MGGAVRLWHGEPHSIPAWGWACRLTQSCLCTLILREPGPSRPGGPHGGKEEPGTQA